MILSINPLANDFGNFTHLKISPKDDKDDKDKDVCS